MSIIKKQNKSDFWDDHHEEWTGGPPDVYWTSNALLGAYVNLQIAGGTNRSTRSWLKEDIIQPTSPLPCIASVACGAGAADRQAIAVGLTRGEGTNTGIRRVANANDRYSYDELLYVRKTYFSPEELASLQVGFVSLSEALDLTTPSGRALAGMLAVFAEFEREILRERVRAGIAQARKDGRPHGRPPTVAKRADRIREMAAQGLSKSEIARRLRIRRTSVRRLLGQA